jgi:hypothetical protein
MRAVRLGDTFRLRTELSADTWAWPGDGPTRQVTGLLASSTEESRGIFRSHTFIQQWYGSKRHWMLK